VNDQWRRSLLVFGILELLGSATSSGSFSRPNAQLTPGAIGALNASAPTVAQVCTRGYARSARHRYDTAWRRYRSALFREYAVSHPRWRQFTIDHLVPIELGGRAFGTISGGWDLRNVWPEPKAEAKRKDAVEDALHDAVCSRRGYHGLHLTLAQAQRAIAADWTRTPVGLPRADIREHRRAFRMPRHSP